MTARVHSVSIRTAFGGRGSIGATAHPERLRRWRRRTGIEPAGDAQRRPPVLKTGEPTRCPDASGREPNRQVAVVRPGKASR